MYTTLQLSIENNICTITINRPDKLNALNRTVINELSDALDEVYTNSDIRSAIITGTGPKSFVAGADISEFLLMDSKQGKALARTGQELVFNKIEHCPKPIVAAVNGFALGGGCELAMACHFRLASDNAKFGLPEAGLGLIPGYGGTQRLTQLIGKGRAIEVMITGKMLDSDTAMQYGLVNKVTTPDQLLNETKSILSMANNKAPLSVAGCIRAVNQVYSTKGFETEINIFGDLFDTTDAKEGTAAFLEKRKPNFTGN